MILKKLLYFVTKKHSIKPTRNDQELVKKSLTKYMEAYKLLEEYDKKPVKHSEELADPGRLRKVIRELQKPNGDLGTHTSI